MKPAPAVLIAAVRCDCGAAELRFVLPGDATTGPIRGWCSARCWRRACEAERRIPKKPLVSEKVTEAARAG